MVGLCDNNLLPYSMGEMAMVKGLESLKVWVTHSLTHSLARSVNYSLLNQMFDCP